MSRRTKGWLIAAVCLVLVGGILFTGVMTVLKWNFRKLATDKYETNTYTITDAFTNISVDVNTADVVLAPSADGTVSVVCHEEIQAKHSVTVEGETLVIKAKDSRKWYQKIGFHLSGPKVTICLPAGAYGALTMKVTTGDITIPKAFSFASMDLKVTTGDITCSADVVGDVTLKNTTGDVKVSSMTCRQFTSTGTTGDITLRDVIATDTFFIKRSTGDVSFAACDAASLTVKTTTGDITGSLLTAKVFDAHATTGHVDVPQSTEGGSCKLSATTGNIMITIQ